MLMVRHGLGYWPACDGARAAGLVRSGAGRVSCWAWVACAAGRRLHLLSRLGRAEPNLSRLGRSAGVRWGAVRVRGQALARVLLRGGLVRGKARAHVLQGTGLGIEPRRKRIA